MSVPWATKDEHQNQTTKATEKQLFICYGLHASKWLTGTVLWTFPTPLANCLLADTILPKTGDSESHLQLSLLKAPS